MRDSSEQRLERLRALREAGPSTGPARHQAPAGRRFSGAAAAPEGGMRGKLLAMLTAVGDDDDCVPGTEVGQRQLEQLLTWLSSVDGRPQLEKLRARIEDLLDPRETDGGLEFDAEGVEKLLAFLRQPASGGDGGRGGRPRGPGKFPGRGMGRRWR